MSDQWLTKHVKDLKDSLDPETYGKLIDAIGSGTARKQVVIYRNSGFNGRTITKGFADDLPNTKIDDIVIIGSAI